MKLTSSQEKQTINTEVSHGRWEEGHAEEQSRVGAGWEGSQSTDKEARAWNHHLVRPPNREKEFSKLLHMSQG